MQLTLIAPTTDRAGIVPAGYAIHPCGRGDIPALGALYFGSYEPERACATQEEAVADIVASFDGEYGAFWPEASPVAVAGGRLVAAVLTVRRAPWDDTPDCPFIIEVFTAPAHRRRGLARALLTACLDTVARAGGDAVALRVGAENTDALTLYEEIGFELWHPAIWRLAPTARCRA